MHVLNKEKIKTSYLPNNISKTDELLPSLEGLGEVR
jgi:hypothetical protein